MSNQAEGRSNVATAGVGANSAGHVGPQNKRPVVLIYPTVSPETVVIPIISCILGFPLLALLVICCLRRRAKLAREQARRRNCDIEHGRSSRAVSLRSERAMSRGFPSLELDTVVEERSDPEPEATVIEMMTPDGDNDNDVEEDITSPTDNNSHHHHHTTTTTTR